MKLEARIQFDASSTANTAAVLVAGSCAMDWLAAAAQMGLPTDRLRVLPVAGGVLKVTAATDTVVLPAHAGIQRARVDDGLDSRVRGNDGEVRGNDEGMYWHDERGPFAALLIGDGIEGVDWIDGASAGDGRDSFLPLRYRCIARRLFVPLHATVSPPVAEDEWQALLPGDSSDVLVWHPRCGLIQFEASMILTFADLLTAPRCDDASWNAAIEGKRLNDRLRSLSPLKVISPQELLEQGRGDIGRDSDQLKNAPKAPDENPHPGITDAFRSAKRWVGRQVFRITDGIPSSPNGSKWLGRLHNWAARLSERAPADGGTARGSAGNTHPYDERLSAKRENELKRLLHMLQTDPDKGLRFAIPYSQGSRGKAPPGGHLGENTPDFSLSSLFGSGPADVWDIPWVWQAKLFHSYRELAARETRLGNHRRAAYIHASLLGDLHAAANSLVAGRHFRDAAELYRKHLNQPLRAAQCLRDAGDWEEALTIYRDHQEWIEAGNLLMKMDDIEAARECFASEVATRRRRLDFPGAAEVADQQLNDPEQASELLLEGWSSAAHAERCLKELLSLNARRGRHEQSLTTMSKLADQRDNTLFQKVAAARAFSESSTQYPDQKVREVARQRTWSLGSQLIENWAGESLSAGLNAVGGLARSDELLQSDVRRFRAKLEKEAAAAQPSRAKPWKPVIARTATRVPEPVRTDRSVQVVAKAILRSESDGGLGILQRVCIDRDLCFVTFEFGMVPFIEVACFRISKLQTNGLQPMEHTRLQPLVRRGGAVEDFRACRELPGTVYLQQIPGIASLEGVLVCEPILRSFPIKQLKRGQDAVFDLAVSSTGEVIVVAFGSSPFGQLLEYAATGELRKSTELRAPEDYELDGSLWKSFRVLAWKQRTTLCFGQSLLRLPQTQTMETLDGIRSEQFEGVPLVLVTKFPLPIQRVATCPEWMVERIACSFDSGVHVVWPETGESVALAANLKCPHICFLNNGQLVAVCSQTGRIEVFRLREGDVEITATHTGTATAPDVIGVYPGEGPNKFYLVQADGWIVEMSA